MLEFFAILNHYPEGQTCPILGKQPNHQERRIMIENLSNDSMTILTQVLEEMKQEKGNEFDLRKVNLAELERRTGISRKSCVI